MIYITNYTGKSAYTNADLQTKGIPLTAYKQDSLGRITAFADANTGEFNGDGRYVDTGWMPKANGVYTIEMMMYFDDTIEYGFNGMYHNSNNDFNLFIGYYAGVTKLCVRIGNILEYVTVPLNTYIMMHIVLNQSNSRVYINSEDKLADFSSVNITSDAYRSFWIGAANHPTRRPFSSPVGLFKIHNKELTQEEVNQEYDDAVAMYPDKLTPRI